MQQQQPGKLHTHVSVPYWSPDIWLGLELLRDIQFGLPAWPKVGVATQKFAGAPTPPFWISKSATVVHNTWSSAHNLYVAALTPVTAVNVSSKKQNNKQN